MTRESRKTFEDRRQSKSTESSPVLLRSINACGAVNYWYHGRNAGSYFGAGVVREDAIMLGLELMFVPP